MQLWCEDGEAPEPLSREGRKGRTGHRWFTRGPAQMPAAFRWPGHDDAFALVLPEARAVTMDMFLAQFSELMLDQAGWHGRAALQVLGNVTLLPLPPYSPELNPMERVWLYLWERYLSFRLYRSEQAIVDAPCAAWNALRDETGRLTTLTGFPWIAQAIGQVSK